MKPGTPKRVCITCCGLLVILLILIAIAVIVLRVLLKPRQTRLQVNSVRLEEFNGSFNFPTLRPDISLVLTMGVQVYNPNRASFKYTNSTVLMFYHGDQCAQTLVPAGLIPARDSVNISTTLTVDADRVIGNPQLVGDLRNGTLPVTTKSEIRGRVNIWNIYKHKMVSISSCSIVLSVSNRSVAGYDCDTKNVF